MKVELLKGFQVEIDSRSADLGAGWHKNKKRGGRVQVLEQHMLAFFDAQITKRKTKRVLDVGASAGSYSLLAIRHPGLKVLAFEPNPEVFAILRKNIALNGLQDRVKPVPYALFDKNGVMQLKIPANPAISGMACVGQPKRFRNWRAINVKARKLDGLVDMLESSGFLPIDLMKIDTEGAELHVLRGAQSLIKRFRPGILLEYTPKNTQQFGYKPQAIKDLLTSWGYRNFRKFGVDLWASA